MSLFPSSISPSSGNAPSSGERMCNLKVALAVYHPRGSRRFISLFFAADKVGGIVGIPGAFVLRDRRIRAQRPGHQHLVIWREFCGNHIPRRNIFLYPIDQGIKHSILRTVAGGDSQLAKRGWARPTGAMLHAWRHVEAHERVCLLRAYRLLNALVVGDAAPGRDGRIIPTVIHNQFAAAL